MARVVLLSGQRPCAISAGCRCDVAGAMVAIAEAARPARRVFRYSWPIAEEAGVRRPRLVPSDDWSCRVTVCALLPGSCAYFDVYLDSSPMLLRVPCCSLQHPGAKCCRECCHPVGIALTLTWSSSRADALIPCEIEGIAKSNRMTLPSVRSRRTQ